jgi:hypothetical protein
MKLTALSVVLFVNSILSLPRDTPKLLKDVVFNSARLDDGYVNSLTTHASLYGTQPFDVATSDFCPADEKIRDVTLTEGACFEFCEAGIKIDQLRDRECFLTIYSGLNAEPCDGDSTDERRIPQGHDQSCILATSGVLDACSGPGAMVKYSAIWSCQTHLLESPPGVGETTSSSLASTAVDAVNLERQTIFTGAVLYDKPDKGRCLAKNSDSNIVLYEDKCLDLDSGSIKVRQVPDRECRLRFFEWAGCPNPQGIAHVEEVGMGGDFVCLATGFRPRVSGSVKWTCDEPMSSSTSISGRGDDLLATIPSIIIDSDHDSKGSQPRSATKLKTYVDLYRSPPLLNPPTDGCGDVDLEESHLAIFEGECFELCYPKIAVERLADRACTLKVHHASNCGTPLVPDLFSTHQIAAGDGSECFRTGVADNCAPSLLNLKGRGSARWTCEDPTISLAELSLGEYLVPTTAHLGEGRRAIEDQSNDTPSAPEVNKRTETAMEDVDAITTLDIASPLMKRELTTNAFLYQSGLGALLGAECDTRLQVTDTGLVLTENQCFTLCNEYIRVEALPDRDCVLEIHHTQDCKPGLLDSALPDKHNIAAGAGSICIRTFVPDRCGSPHLGIKIFGSAIWRCDAPAPAPSAEGVAALSEEAGMPVAARLIESSWGTANDGIDTMGTGPTAPNAKSAVTTTANVYLAGVDTFLGAECEPNLKANDHPLTLTDGVCFVLCNQFIAIARLPDRDCKLRTYPVKNCDENYSDPDADAQILRGEGIECIRTYQPDGSVFEPTLRLAEGSAKWICS